MIFRFNFYVNIFLLLIIKFAALSQSDSFSFIVISDTHISQDTVKDKKLAYFVKKFNSDFSSDETDFIVVLGDFVSYVYRSRELRSEGSNMLIKAISIIRGLSKPFYLIMGNHDYRIDTESDSDAKFEEEGIAEMEMIWKGITGFEPYYLLDFKGWRLIFLNGFRGRYRNKFFDGEQMKWLEMNLTKGMPTIIFSHYPICGDLFCSIYNKLKKVTFITPDIEPYFFKLLKRYKDDIKVIFCGHAHKWLNYKIYDEVPVYVVSSFGESGGIPFYRVHINKNKVLIKKIWLREQNF